MVTKLAGPFKDTCRFSISPRSRLRLRPARRAALTITLIRAECSMISAQDDLSIRSGRDGDRVGDRRGASAPVGALRLSWRQGWITLRPAICARPLRRSRDPGGVIGPALRPAWDRLCRRFLPRGAT